LKLQLILQRIGTVQFKLQQNFQTPL
jgi:hypothetical protein